MPLGYDLEGNPYGVTLIGRKGSDARLITIMSVKLAIDPLADTENRKQWESAQPPRRVPERLRHRWNVL
jgi:hypothetical protein